MSKQDGEGGGENIDVKDFDYTGTIWRHVDRTLSLTPKDYANNKSARSGLNQALDWLDALTVLAQDEKYNEAVTKLKAEAEQEPEKELKLPAKIFREVILTLGRNRIIPYSKPDYVRLDDMLDGGRDEAVKPD